MADEEQRLIDEAAKSREDTQELREESGLGRESDPEPPPTSSSEADQVTDDE